MSAKLKIDFVSDVSCPWCVIGLTSLERALSRLRGVVEAEIHCQPFELNPQMSPAGQDLEEHIAQKFGAARPDMAASRESLRERGATLGFHFDFDRRGRIYNTFDAHRLLHWAGIEGKQLRLKHALFQAYFVDGKDPSNADVLVELARSVGLDPSRARHILESQEFAEEVRSLEARYMGRGIRAVPSVIINDQYLLQGGQPVEAYENALRSLTQKQEAVAAR
jgi:predicted DsbA family dithiol-disulfide isomerase